MRILLTGGGGFVGQHVCNYLSKHDNVTVHSPSHAVLDLLDFYSLRDCLESIKPDVVVHLAAVCGGIGANKKAPGRFLYENLQMGINLLEAVRAHNEENDDNIKVVNLGTVCMYPKYADVPFVESQIWEGYPEETNAPYGIAKKTVVEMAIAYHKQYNLNTVNLIPVNMAGEYDHFHLENSHVIPALVRKFTEAKERNKDTVQLWGTGEASREFLYAGDLARAVYLAATKVDNYPKPINIGTGKEITIKQLANKIKDKIGFEGKIEWDTRQPDGQPRRCLNVELADALMEFRAETGIEEILDRTIGWYNDHREEVD